jgi:hypothetical protein
MKANKSALSRLRKIEEHELNPNATITLSDGSSVVIPDDRLIEFGQQAVFDPLSEAAWIITGMVDHSEPGGSQLIQLMWMCGRTAEPA